MKMTRHFYSVRMLLVTKKIAPGHFICKFIITCCLVGVNWGF